MALRIDLECLPIIYFAVHDELTPADLAHLTNAFHERFRARTRFVVICDGRGVSTMPDAKMRGAIADWIKSIQGQRKAYCLGSANVFASAPVRGVLTALEWLVPSSVPQHYVGDLEHAIAWCESRLRAEGIDGAQPATRLRTRLKIRATE